MKSEKKAPLFWKSLRIFITSWCLLLTQVWATHEFYRGVNGLLIVDPQAPMPEGREFRQAKQRVFDFAREIANMRGVDRNVRNIATRLQSTASTMFYPEFRREDATRQYGEVRDLLNQLQAADPDLVRRVLTENEYLNRSTTLPQGRNHHRTILTSQNSPNYCDRYPLIDREAMQGFYGNPQPGEGLECYSPGGNMVGLDLSTVKDAMMSVEENGYESRSRDLKNKLILKTVDGILKEGQAYSGLFEDTDDDLGKLKRCAAGDGRRAMGNNSLEQKINSLESEKANRVSQLNETFGGQENRLNAFIANQVRQALIIGNLYNITSRARSQDGRQVATVGGDERAFFTPEVRESCFQRIENQFGFAYPDRHNMTAITRLNQRCHQLVREETYASRAACLDAYRQLVADNPQMERAQLNCLYEQSGRGSEAPRDIQADHLIPLMSASVNSNPLLFDREDSRSLIPFVSSESNYIPSELAEQIQGLSGASAISRAVEDLLATNPENPKEAIDNLLNNSPIKEQLQGIIQTAQQDESLKDKLKDEVEDYQEELAESAFDVCDDDGEFLHHFPALVDDVIADELQSTQDPRERERILAQHQAAQCWLLREKPPEESGGLPLGFIALGVGAIALGIIPGIGWAAAGALIAAGTTVGAVDVGLRLTHSQDRLEATTAAFNGGWAEAQDLLLAAAQRTDAETAAWVEGLSIGILDGAGLLFRASRIASRAPPVITEAGVRANAALGNTERTALIRQLHPSLNQNQIDAIMRAHSEVPCPVYNCSIAQLRRKRQIMDEAGVPLEVQRDVIRRGIAGSTDESFEFIADQNLASLRFQSREISNPVEAIEAISSPSSRSLWDLDARTTSHFLHGMDPSDTRHLQATTRQISGVNTPVRGTLDMDDVARNPQDYVVLYHGTETNGARGILNNGINTSLGDGEFGRGAYFTSSPDQAREWARLKGENGADPQVIQVIIPRSRLQEIADRGNSMAFPRSANTMTPSDPDVNYLFTNFVNSNSALRDSSQLRNVDPLENIDFISGPTQSTRQGGHDQIKFGDTEASRRLFDLSSEILVRAII